MKNKVVLACLAIALLEGFAGLGIEIYAIRISAVYIGASTSITGVILALVLLAIAAGYWFGGKLSEKADSANTALSKAGRVLALSAVCHAIACIIQLPLLDLMTRHIDNPIVSALGVGLLFAGGLAFGSMSIPLITQFLSLKYKASNHEAAGKNAGMMVAVTTVGSVLGSTATPILLLPYIGLMSSLTLFVTCLALSSVLCTILASKNTVIKSGVATPTQSISYLRNYILALSALVATLSFIAINKTDTGFQTATTAWFVGYVDFDGELTATITDYPNRSISSCWMYDTHRNCSWYGEQAIEAIKQTDAHKTLFVGGAGLAMPSELAYSDPEADITVIDIDKDLPEIVEKHFLKEPIAKNIKFVGDDARGYLNRNPNEHYDFVFIDAFQGSYVAGNLFTLEALTKFKKTSNNLMANVIGKTDINHNYTQTVLKNWYEVFGDDGYILTFSEDAGLQNLILCNFACEDGKQLSKMPYFNVNAETHTDDMPRLDKYTFRAI